jgi:tartrate dehydratase beta subunit/fumarate hydratase class I family protein
MTFPTASTTSLAIALNDALVYAGQLKAEAQTVRALCVAGPVDAIRMTTFESFLADKADAFTSLAAVSGLGAYAQTQLGNGTLNIAAEFTSMQAALNSVRNWIGTNYPKAASGEILERKFDAQGRTITNTFSTAQTAGLVTVLDALIAAIG